MPPQTAIFLGDALSHYHFGESHPFGPRRYSAFYDEFMRRGLDKQVQLMAPVSASEEDILLFQTAEYLDRVKHLSRQGEGYFDVWNTPVVPGIYEAAATVVGTTLRALHAIMQGECRRAFVPIAGLHHARRDSAAGFCVFNDCGVAIEALRRRYGIQRVAYVDIDAHHGDGVFYSFEHDPHLTFVDLHEDGRYLYPGTGFDHETGSGDAIGTKLNLSLPPDAGDEHALALWSQAEAFLRAARPEFILLQCGADSVAGDPITHLRLTPAFHRFVAQRVSLLADELGHGRVLAMGGGGYHLVNIANTWNDVVEGLSYGPR